jgi:phosphoserine aminotransferase
MKKVHNFSAGPSILPAEVIQQTAAAIQEFDGMGLSILEISHRSKNFEKVVAEARQSVKEILNLPERFEVLFLQGGATLGFHIAAMNFMKEGGKAVYANTGVWASGAIKEAKLLGQVDVPFDSASSNHNYIPDVDFKGNYDYAHYTSNNTIYGTQYHYTPKAEMPLVCDMSSDIFSRPVNAEAHALIYAGAQKNLGPAGTTLYIVDKEKLGHTGRKLPVYMDLQAHIDKDSMYNTPPVLAIYTCMLTLRWIKEIGGLEGMEKRNNAKQTLFYNEVDRNGLFHGHAVPEARSWMNPTFRLNNDALAADFDAMWKEAGISGIAGHRSVGGYRASMYNALPIESVQVLVDVMKEFERVKG